VQTSVVQPVYTTPSPITPNQNKLGQATLVKVLTETLAANSSKIYQAVGDHLFLYSSTGSAGQLTFSFDDQSAQGILTGQVVASNDKFSTVQIANITGAPITYTIIISNGAIDFKGFVVSNTVTVTDIAAEASLATIVGNWITELANWVTALGYLLTLSNIVQGKQGTQVVSDSGASPVNATTLIHTVTALKNLYIQSAWVTADAQGANVGKTSIQIFTAGSAYVNEVIGIISNSVSGVGQSIGGVSISFPSPIVVPAGYLIKLVQNGATLPYGSGGITGYEQ
jgi:hypothetical protein